MWYGMGTRVHTCEAGAHRPRPQRIRLLGSLLPGRCPMAGPTKCHMVTGVPVWPSMHVCRRRGSHTEGGICWQRGRAVGAACMNRQCGLGVPPRFTRGVAQGAAVPESQSDRGAGTLAWLHGHDITP